jgi:hypothetical protein
MSSIPSYGIPDPTATANAVISQLEANANDLASVQAALQQGIGTAAGDSFSELAQLQKTLRSTISRAANYTQKQLQAPQQAVSQALAAQQAMIAGSMPARESLYAMPGPLQTPAGYPAPGVLPQAPLVPRTTAAPSPSSLPGGASGSGSPGAMVPPSAAGPAGGTPTGAPSTAAPGCTPDNPCYAILPGPGGCAILEPVYYVTDPLLGSAVRTFQPGQLAEAQTFLAQYNQQHCGQSAAAAPPATTVPPPTPASPVPVPVPPTPSSPVVPATGPPPGGGTGSFSCPSLAQAVLSPESPGSEAWCAQVQSIRGAVVAMGQDLVKVLTSLSDDSLLGPALNPIPFIGSTLASLVGSTGVFERLRCIVNANLAAVRSIVPCAAADYLALIALRTTLHSLEKLELGTDALVWAVNAFRISFGEAVKIVDYLIALTCPVEIPGAPEAMEAFLHGTIGRGQYECWLLCHGHDPKVWEPVLRSRRDRLTPREAIEYGFRNGWTQEQIQGRLNQLGFIDPQDQAERLAMHFHLPTIGDQLHFLQRNVFMKDYVKQYRLDEGFLERYWSEFGTQLLAVGVPQETARLHYAAHWINPAPTEMREFVYRLRPDKPGVQNPFTLDDYQRLLVEQDVAPFFRERFQETVYRVPALGYVRDMYRSFIMDDEELRSIHQDLGYSPKDSERFLRVDKLIRARIRSSEAHGWTPAAIAQGWVSGGLSRDRVYALMRDQGFQDWESDALVERAEAGLKYNIFIRARSQTIWKVTMDLQQGLEVGTWTREAAVQALTDLGFDQSFAEGWVGVQMSRAQTKLVKQTVSRLRSGYLRGELDDQGAMAALQSLNLTQESIERYIVSWKLSLTPKRKSLSKSEIIKEVCAGHMTTAEALARLLNLGYSEEDSGLYLADAQQCLVKRRQQAELAEQRKASAAASQIQRLRKEAQSQAKQLGSQARRLEPVAKLQKWARLGLIDAGYFTQRLRSYGYSGSEIDRYWDEAASAKGSQAESGATSTLHPP